MTQTLDNCSEVRRLFQKEYGVADDNIIELCNIRKNIIDLEYDHLRDRLKNSNQNTLIVHVFAGHSSITDDYRTLLTNEFDSESKHYRQFQAEMRIQDLARNCPNVYNLAVFACPQSKQKD